MADDAEAPEEEPVLNPWRAGRVTHCQGGPEDDHHPTGIHVVVRCRCGAAYMSTDGAIALRMSLRHADDTEGKTNRGAG
jgi:hypothetical protein